MVILSDCDNVSDWLTFLIKLMSFVLVSCIVKNVFLEMFDYMRERIISQQQETELYNLKQENKSGHGLNISW